MRRRPKEWARQTSEAFEFHLRPPVWDEVIDDCLPFGDEGNQNFCEVVSECVSYLEFGAGSSTIMATRMCEQVTTVESDFRFLEAIERRCEISEGSEFNLLHADIGRTGPWGKPIFPAIPRFRTWRGYPETPWSRLGADFRADAILIDGRFRVACALTVVLHQPDLEWIMLFDDYEDRMHYAPITEFAAFRGMHGRMAEFGPLPNISRDGLARAFEHHVSDWR